MHAVRGCQLDLHQAGARIRVAYPYRVAAGITEELGGILNRGFWPAGT